MHMKIEQQGRGAVRRVTIAITGRPAWTNAKGRAETEVVEETKHFRQSPLFGVSTSRYVQFLC